MKPKAKNLPTRWSNHRLACLAAILLAAATAAAPALVEVRQDGLGDATTIADGLAMSSPGEEIRVTDSSLYLETGLTLSGGRMLVATGFLTTIRGSGTIVTISGSGRLEGFIVETNDTCVEVLALDGSAPQVVNCGLQGFMGITTGLSVRNGVTSLATPATVTLQGLSFDDHSVGLVHSGAGPGNNPAEAGCVYNVSVLFFSNTSNEAMQFFRPSTGTFADVTIDQTGADAIHFHSGSRFSDLTFANLAATNIAGDGLAVGEENLAATLRDPSIAADSCGVAVLALPMPVANRPTINIEGTGSIISSGVAISLGAPAIANIEQIALSASAGTFPEGVGIHAPNFASGVSVTAVGATFQGCGDRAVHATSGSVTVDANSAWSFADCRFLDSGNGDVFFDAASSTGNTLSFNRCLFRENAARPAAGPAAIALSDVPTTLTNCVLDLDSNGGVAQTGAAPLSIVHSTIVAPSGVSVDGLNALSAALTLRNSIVDVPSGTAATGPASWTEGNNCFRGTIAGGLPVSPSSVAADPLFTTPSTGSGTGDFTPSPGSPCPGLGDPGLGVAVDLNGDPRPVPMGSNPDAGAYETILLPVEVSGFGLE